MSVKAPLLQSPALDACAAFCFLYFCFLFENDVFCVEIEKKYMGESEQQYQEQDTSILPKDTIPKEVKAFFVEEKIDKLKEMFAQEDSNLIITFDTFS